MGSPVDVALADLARVLARLSVDWYLFGAQAAILYGSARVTEDIDVETALGQSDLLPAFTRLAREARAKRTDGTARAKRRAGPRK